MLRRLWKLRKKLDPPPKLQNTIPIIPKQESTLPKYAYTIDDWTPRFPELWKKETWQKASLLNIQPSQEEWSQKVDILGDGIYRFPCFDAVFFEKLATEIAHLETWAQKHCVTLNPPNSMHDYGIMMSVLGLEQPLQEIIIPLANQFISHYFPEFSTYLIDHHHSFSVTYDDQHNHSLGFHADDSEITFNFCLAGDFVGSELYFQGRRCFSHLQSPHRPDEHIEIEQKIGHCIVHAGLHRHGVLPIIRGTRRSLIVWSRSSQYRQKQPDDCPSWCGVNNIDTLT